MKREESFLRYRETGRNATILCFNQEKRVEKKDLRNKKQDPGDKNQEFGFSSN